MPLPTPLPPAKTIPVTGVLRVLVIAVAFADFNSTITISDLRQTWGQVDAYYKEVSYGSVSLQIDVFGWYVLPYVMAYYGKDCIGIDDTDCSGEPASWQIARDAVSKAGRTVNFNNYDYFAFVHSGYGQESSRSKNDVWSVTYLGGLYVPTNNKTLTKFEIVPELEAQGATTLGVYAHEFGHLLGLPDLYDTTSGKSIVGVWTLMDKGLWDGSPPGSSPAHLEAWSKIQLGWISGDQLGVANSGALSNFTVLPTELQSSGIHAVEVPVSTDSPASKYYLVEVRKRIGFDAALPSEGVLITSVNEKSYIGRVTVINGHPAIPSLADATWNVGQSFTDEKNNIAIAILSKVGDSFQISVNRRAPMADIVVSRIYAEPSTVSPNSTVSIHVEITNQGTVSASNVPVQVLLDGQPFANTQVSVPAGSTSQLSFDWTAISGSHTFRVVVDPLDTLTELNKGNNVETFTLNVGPTLIITVPLDVSTGNTTAWVRINGIDYRPNNSSQVKVSVPSGPVSVEIEPEVNVSLGVRQVFAGWSDGSTENPRQVIMTSETRLSATYKAQYLLTVFPNGGSTTSSGWYDANTTATLQVASPSNTIAYRSQLIFTNWSGDVNSNSLSLSVNMTRPTTVTANWKSQYYVRVISAIGSPSGDGWYYAGDTATVDIQTPVESGNGTRQVFVGWNDTETQGSVARFTVNAPTMLQASWKSQYYVQVHSSYGNPQGTGWYDAGTYASISVQPQVSQGNRTRRMFAGWAGDYSGSDTTTIVQVNSPKTLTAKWTTQYQLVFKVSGIPNSTYARLIIDNASYDISVNDHHQAWFDLGATINPSTNQTLWSGIMVYRFTGWSNSTGIVTESPFIVTGPQDYTAVYTSEIIIPPIPGFPMESILVGLGLGLLVTLCSRRRGRMRRTTGPA